MRWVWPVLTAALLAASVSDLPAQEPGEAAVEVAQETATVEGPNGGQIAIAPGVMSLRDLTRSVDVLRESLERLGTQAAGVDKNLALVVHDDYAIGTDRIVSGNLALLSGDLELDGTVEGSVLVLDGTLTLGASALVEGDVLQVGGEIVESGGRVTGELVSLVAGDVADLIESEIAAEADRATPPPARVRVSSDGPGFVGRIGHNIGRAFAGLFGALAWWLALGTLGLAVVYFFRQRLEVVADTVRTDMVRSFGIGLAGQLLVIPVLLLLVIGIVTWLVIPAYALAVALAIPAGYLAVAHGVGETVAEQRYDWMERYNLRRTNSYYYVFSGLAFLLAPFAIGSVLYLLGGMMGFVRGLMFFAAGVLTWAAVTTGFGAILLTRAGGRRSGRTAADYDDLFAAPSFDEPEGEASA